MGSRSVLERWGGSVKSKPQTVDRGQGFLLLAPLSLCLQGFGTEALLSHPYGLYLVG